MKRLKHTVVAMLLAAAMVAAVPRYQSTIHAAEPFWNCVTIWYIEMCYWVDPEDPTDSDLFNSMWYICSLINLC